MNVRLFYHVPIACALMTTACEKSTTISQQPLALSQGSPHQEDWLVTGRMATKDFEHGEVVALALDGTRTRTEIKPDQSFALNLSGDNTYAVYFLAAPTMNNTAFSASNFINTATGPSLQSRPPALLTLEENEESGMQNTLRLPKAGTSATIDLGAINIKGDFAYTTNKPSTKLDFDGDGINDSQDPDTRQNSDLERVALCHKGQDLTLALPSLLAHLNHGDHLGKCEDDEREDDKITNTSDLSIKDDDHHHEASHQENTKLKPPSSQQTNAPIFIEESEDNSDSDYYDQDDQANDDMPEDDGT